MTWQTSLQAGTSPPPNFSQKSIGSRSLTRADLNLLLATRNDLTAQIAAEEDNGLFSDTYVAFFDGR